MIHFRPLAPLAVALLVPALVHAQTPSALVREGDDITGSGGLVTAMSGVASNGIGGYAVRTITGTIDRIWGDNSGAPGTVLVSENDSHHGAGIGSFESNFGLSDNGLLAYGLIGMDDFWVHDVLGGTNTLVAAENDPILSLPGSTFRFNSNMKITRSGIPYWRGGINASPSSDTGLFVGTSHTVLIKTGDAAPSALPMGTLSGANAAAADARLSAMGTHWINDLDTDLAGTMDGWLTIDGSVATTSMGTLIGEGEAIPASSGGMAGENWAFFDYMYVNEDGDFWFSGDTGLADTARDEVIVENGNILWREGDVIDGLTVTGALINNYVDFNENGDVAFGWNTSLGETLFLNGTRVIAPGDAVDWDGDGILDPAVTMVNFPGVGGLGISEPIAGAIHVFFVAETTNGEGFFRAIVPVADVLQSFCNGDGGDQLGCTDCPCGNNAVVGTEGGCLNSNASSARLQASGVPSVLADTLHFDVLTANPATFGILTSGDNRLPNSPANICFTQNPGSGVQALGVLDGLRCVGGSLLRHGSRATDANGDIGITNNGWGPPSPPAAGLIAVNGFVAGQTRHFQCFYREDALAGCMSGQNTTNAVSVTVVN